MLTSADRVVWTRFRKNCKPLAVAIWAFAALEAVGCVVDILRCESLVARNQISSDRLTELIKTAIGTPQFAPYSGIEMRVVFEVLSFLRGGISVIFFSFAAVAFMVFSRRIERLWTHLDDLEKAGQTPSPP